MEKPETWVVTHKHTRQCGPQGECFYCGARVGDQHNKDCVCRKRTVVVRATVDYVVSVPEDWDVDMISFHRNEGSWCADNGIAEIMELTKRRDAAGMCMCDMVKYEYVREADIEDEARCLLTRSDNS